MAILWLPFYDLGRPIGPGQPNHSLDIKLFGFLTNKLAQKAASKMATPPPSVSRSAIEAGLPPSAEWIQWWLKWSGSPALQSPVVLPAHQGSQSLMKKLNKEYCNLFPAEFVNPTFSFSNSGALTLTNLPGHMALSKCLNSGWLGLKATAEGPIREVPYYDLSANFGLNSPNLGGDTCLVSALLKQIQGGLPGFLKNFQLGPNAVAGPSAVPVFAQAASEAGWPSSPSETVIYPDGGLGPSTTLTRALNHFALKANRNGFIALAGAASGNIGAMLVQDLQANRKSKFW
jgi:hypothetical protein